MGEDGLEVGLAERPYHAAGPVIADQHHLGPGLVGVLEQAGELAAADHAGLVDHQQRAGVQLLLAAVEVGEEAVAGGHVLESLALQAQGGDPGRGRCQEPVAVQLPMAGDAEGEGLAGPGPADHQGDTVAALAQVAAVQGRPASVRPLHPVGDDQMSVQQRIALTGGPVIKTDRQDPCPDTCWTPPWPRRTPRCSSK